MNSHAACLAALAGLACSSHALAQVTPEVEPNELRTNATAVLAPMQAGHTLTGTTTGSFATAGDPASFDQFRIKTAAAKPGIYRYRLILTTSGTAGHTGSIRALTQVPAVHAPWPGAVGTPTSTDTMLQSSSSSTLPSRFNQWYGFGRAEELYYRVAGTASTTGGYTATLDRTTVTPTIVAGTFQAGAITISSLAQGHTTDTEFWVYDASFNAIDGYGNDDEAEAAISGVPGTTGATLQSVLRRTYAAGTYYLAVSDFAMSNNKGSPCDDDIRHGVLLDFADVIAQGDIQTGFGLAFSITDGVTTTTMPNTKDGPYEINWFKFTVGGGGPGPCYADCDQVGGLTANDFICFISAFIGGASYADCDLVGGLTANDFICFLQAYNIGCS